MQPVQFSGNVFGDFGRDVTKIAERSGTGGNERTGNRQVGGELFVAGAGFVIADDAIVEVLHVEHGEFDLEVTAIGERAVGIIVMRIVMMGRVHGLGVVGSSHDLSFLIGM